MIRVTIELFPHGRKDKKLKLHVIDIENTGYRIEQNIYKYQIMLDKDTMNFPLLKHTRSENVFVMLRNALDTIIKTTGKEWLDFYAEAKNE